MLKKVISSMILGALLAAPLTAAFTVSDNNIADAEYVRATYIEDHSVIDCTNRFKGSYTGYMGAYLYTIKIPKGEIKNISLYVSDEAGNLYFLVTNLYCDKNLKYLYSDETSDYYQYAIPIGPYEPDYNLHGMGIKLFYDKDDVHKMATNTANGSTVEGTGYFLDSDFSHMTIVEE